MFADLSRLELVSSCWASNKQPSREQTSTGGWICASAETKYSGMGFLMWLGGRAVEFNVYIGRAMAPEGS